MDAGNLLKPALARGELRTIGATTLDEYQKYIEKDAALERRFQPVQVGEPSVPGHDRHPARPEAAVRDAPRRPHHRRRDRRAATLSDRYITDRFLPDKAIDLIDEAASRLRIENDSMPQELDEIRRRVMSAADRDRGAARRERPREQAAAGQGRKGAGRSAGAQQRADRPVGEREGRDGRHQAGAQRHRPQAGRAGTGQRQGNWEVAARIQYGELRDLQMKTHQGRVSG